MAKTVFVIMLITCLFFCGCRQEQKENVQTDQAEAVRTIVAVGDSLTAGLGLDERDSYPAELEKKLQGDGYRYRVVNAGVSGETSSGTLARLEWVLTLQPDIIILETGANDGLRGIDPRLAEKNIRAILEMLKEKDVVVVLAGMKMVWNLGPAYVAEFNGIYPRLAKEFDVIFMPFFLEGVAMKRELNLEDGLHPNAKGYRIITDNIYPYVLQAIKRRSAS